MTIGRPPRAKKAQTRKRATVAELEKLTQLRIELADEKQAHREKQQKLQSDLSYVVDQKRLLEQKLEETEKGYAAEVESHNATRDLLYRTEAALNRLNGYVDGLEDSKPPLMVPENRPSRRDEPKSINTSYDAYEPTSRSYGQKPRPWYHR